MSRPNVKHSVPQCSRVRSALPKPAVALAIAVILAGCATGPRYVRPTVETPAAFKESLAAPAPGWKPAQPRDAELRGAWWEIFRDPELSGLEARVRVSNQTVLKAVATLKEAKAVAGEARALYFPTVGAGAASLRGHTSADVAGALAGRTVTDDSVGLTVSWEPDLFDKIGHEVDAATARAQASAGDLAAIDLSMHAELAIDYFDLRQADAQTALLKDTITAYTQALEMVRQRFAAGVASEYDVSQAEAQLESTRSQLIDIGAVRAALEHAIATLIGLPASEFSLPSNPQEPGPPDIPPGVPSQLLERRPDIAAAERRMAASNADVGSATSAFFPDLMLSATRGFESYGPAGWLTLPSRFWAVGPAIVGTLFDGGLRHRKLEAAQAHYEASVADYRQVVLGSFQEVEDNLAALRVLGEEARTQQAAVAAAQHALDLAMDRYKGGAIDYLSVVTTQTIALSDQRQSTALAGRRLDATVLLVKALGGTWNAGA
jgi:NodT family efflux transporter outer membrane factor (OMF) lipoprotein